MLHQTEISDISYIESLLKVAAKRSEMEFERLQNEKLLEMKNKELERQNIELASFAYISSHDLQEPLRKIQLFASRILFREKSNFSESSLGYFQSITNAANRMQNLIESLLNYSSMDASEIHLVPTDLNVVIDEIKNNMIDILEKRNARIEVAKLPTLPVIPIQFQQLLTNLISNGIKYSREDIDPVIKINAEIVSLEEFAGKQFWKINIEDNGIGFQQEYEEKIFELFKRLHGKTDYEGTGIGLAICKKIVQKHDGFIRAIGTPGVGAQFLVYLPVK
ncbi:Phytochrome-like protein cph1 [compost metagenome]